MNQTKKFRSQLQPPLLIGSVLIVAVIAVFMWLGQRSLETKQQLFSLQNDISHVTSEMLMLRRHEKDFISRVDVRYIDSLVTRIDNILPKFSAIKTTMDRQKLTHDFEYQSLAQALLAYKAAFLLLADQQIAIHGEKSQGGYIEQLKNELFTLERDIFASQNRLMNEQFIEMKAHMFEFFRTFEANDLAQVNQFYQAIANEAANVNGSPLLKVHLTNFMNRFSQLQSAYETLGYNHSQGLHGQLRSDIHNVEQQLKSLFEEVPSHIQQRLDGNEKILKFYTIAMFALVFAILAYIFVAVRRLEWQLHESKLQAQQANRAKSAFLANMSHEIRTPLNGIIGMTEILSDSNLTAQQNDYLSTINVSSQTLLMLINDVLDLSKIESGNLEISLHTCHIREVIFDTAALIAPKAEQKKLAIEIEMDANVPSHVRADEQKLRQVMMNLASNAVKFTEHGCITLQLKCEHINDEQVSLFFGVRDSGIGIAEEKQAHVFEEFRQEDASTSNHYGGTGLGLAIASKIVALMGGEIALSSQKSVGSHFYFRLDFAIDETQSAAQPKQAKLLYCSAQPSNLLLEEAAHYGYEVQQVREVQELVDWASAAPTQDVNASLPIVLLDRASDIQLMPAQLSAPVVFVRLNHHEKLDFGDQVAAYVTLPLLGHRFQALLDNLVQPRLTVDSAGAAHDGNLHRVNQQGATVLVVEDNKVNQAVVSVNLKKLNIEFLIANDGEEAVSLYKQHHQDIGLVLMDCMMPNMDGFEATRVIRMIEDSDQYEPVTIIALTASILDEDIQRCFDCGMNDYLPKPFKRQALVEKLQKMKSSALLLEHE
ncbi:Sensor histidine kinase RcsC [Vibrio stylophorae]|uniref:histidine kinase n=1 Tax=Vibrio stylophorae TaxID=659351 RepID=A0ABM8ZTA8_9VIBR|nr:ATP-binding protein [Vibrio stylophorae]CAH0533556.1 Sensor histidine kinase RcsC [Vibrio stylophorae]